MGWTGHADDANAHAAQLVAAAKAGDQQALQTLYMAAGGASGNEAGAWRPDHRNAAIDAWNTLGMGPRIGDIKNPHHGFLGAIGDVLKVAAPVAGALIPGIGWAGGALIGGLGNAGGQALSGDHFSVGQALGAGALGGIGNAALGNGLGGGASRAFGGGGGFPGAPGIPGAGGAPPAAGAPSAGAGVAGATTTGTPHGLLGALGRFGSVGGALQKYGPLALGGLGMIQNAGQQGAARDLRNKGVAAAERDWQSRAPLRDAATKRLLGPVPGPTPMPNLSDPSDPYARARQPQQQAAPGGY